MEQERSGPIAYLFPSRTFFVAKDIDALRAHGVIVYEQGFGHNRPWELPFNMIAQFFFLLRMRRRKVRTVLSHFAGHHTVLPVLMGFRCHIIVAGADACSFPKIHYGSFRKALMRLSMGISMRRAATILPVHATLERFENTYSDLGPRKQGYAHFVVGLRTPSIAIPYGFAPELWRNDRSGRDLRSALCVATGAAQGNAVHFRKGVDLIVEVASLLPHCRFTIVGVDVDSYKSVPENVQLIGRVSPIRLSSLLSEHGTYLQPSVMEGFPNALCEAMWSGCVPIVSNVTSMPHIVGDTGPVIEQRNAKALQTAIEKLIALTPQQAETMRKATIARVTGFTMRARVQALEAAIHDKPANPEAIPVGR